MRALMKAKASLRFFVRDTQGNSAVEFGVVAPLLLLMMLGTVELGRAIDNDRRFVSAVTSTGDLVAREEYLGKTAAAASANLGSMMLSIKHLMGAYDTKTFKLAVFSVQASPTVADKGKVQWSYSYNGKAAPSKCSDYALPAGLVAKGGSVVVVDASYDFKPLFGTYVPGMTSMTWTEKVYNNPRNSCVDYVYGENCLSPC
jgi:Flp pilus assembly protein TadG